jgi:hypothetical protein
MCVLSHRNIDEKGKETIQNATIPEVVFLEVKKGAG